MTKKEIYGVYFICCLGNYIDIVDEQLQLLHSSGLYNQMKKLIIFACLFDANTNNNLIQILKKYDFNGKFIEVKTSLNLYEKFAINNYKSYIEDNNYYVFYFHTKGTSHSVDENTIFSRRRKILDFYTIQKFELSLKLLNHYDAVGCSLSLFPKKHFSGNFWWSKSEHTDKLLNINDGYLSPEMYICSLEEGNYVSLNQLSNDGNVENHLCKNDQDILSEVTESYIEILGYKALINMCG